jgi:hypothetical protein
VPSLHAPFAQLHSYKGLLSHFIAVFHRYPRFCAKIDIISQRMQGPNPQRWGTTVENLTKPCSTCRVKQTQTHTLTLICTQDSGGLSGTAKQTHTQTQFDL